MCEMELMELTLDRSEEEDDERQGYMFSEDQTSLLPDNADAVDNAEAQADDRDDKSVEANIRGKDMISPLTNHSPHRFEEGSPAGYAVAEAMAAQARALREVNSPPFLKLIALVGFTIMDLVYTYVCRHLIS